MIIDFNDDLLEDWCARYELPSEFIAKTKIQSPGPYSVKCNDRYYEYYVYEISGPHWFYYCKKCNMLVYVLHDNSWSMRVYDDRQCHKESGCN